MRRVFLAFSIVPLWACHVGLYLRGGGANEEGDGQYEYREPGVHPGELHEVRAYGPDAGRGAPFHDGLCAEGRFGAVSDSSHENALRGETLQLGHVSGPGWPAAALCEGEFYFCRPGCSRPERVGRRVCAYAAAEGRERAKGDR